MGSNEALSDVLRGSFFILIGNTIGLGSVFLTRIIAARYLGPPDYGRIVLGITVLNVVSLASLMGLDQGIAQRLPRKNIDIGDITGSLVGAVSVSMLITIAGIFLLQNVGAQVVSSKTVAVLYVFLVSVPAFVLLRLTVGVFRGLESPKMRTMIYDIGNRGLILVLVTIGTVLSVPVVQISLAWFVGAITPVFALIIYRLKNGGNFRGVSLSRQSTAGLILFSLPLMLSQTLWKLIQQVDNLVIEFYLGSPALGIYDTSFTLGRVFLVATSTVGFMFLPVLSKLDDKNKFNQRSNLYTTTTRWMIITTLPLFLAFITFPDSVLQIVFGREYESGPVLIILSIGFYSHIVFGLNGNGLIATNHNKIILRGNGIGLLANVILNVGLVARIGILGAAMASMVTFITTNVYFSYKLFRLERIPPISKSLVPFLCFALLIYGLTILPTSLFSLHGYLNIVLWILFGTLYLIALYVLGVQQSDWEIVKQIINKSTFP